MLLTDIKPVNDDTLWDCFDAALVSVTSWMGKNIELSLLETWGFSFGNPNFEAKSFAQKINIWRSNQHKLLEKFCGIKLIITNKIEDNEMNLIMNELSHNRPVIVTLDSFWCPWDPDYQIVTAGHNFILTGVDECINNFLCCDPAYDKDKVLLPIDHFKKGFRRSYFVTLTSITNPKLNDLFNHLHSFYSETMPKTLDSIRSFSMELLTEFDLDYDLKRFATQLRKCPLVSQLVAASRDRMKISKSFSFMAKSYEHADLMELSLSLEETAELWTVIRKMLLKSVYSKNPYDIINRVSSKLLDAANKEEQLAEKLFNLDINTRKPMIGFHTEEITIEKEAVERNKLTAIDISHLLNNKGLGNLTKEGSGNLTGLGEYYLEETIINNLSVSHSERYFLQNNNEYDNIYCDRQVISIVPGNYSSIMFLGCSEWGSSKQKLMVEYKNGDIEQLQFSFSDWTMLNPLFNEEIACVGKGVQITAEGLKILNKSVYMFSQVVPINKNKELISVTLPECPSIHVFAATLTSD